MQIIPIGWLLLTACFPHSLSTLESVPPKRNSTQKLNISSPNVYLFYVLTSETLKSWIVKLKKWKWRCSKTFHWYFRIRPETTRTLLWRVSTLMLKTDRAWRSLFCCLGATCEESSAIKMILANCSRARWMWIMKRLFILNQYTPPIRCWYEMKERFCSCCLKKTNSIHLVLSRYRFKICSAAYYASCGIWIS